MASRTPKRKTKIVCTLGPASSSPEVIRELIATGANVIRLNFSHGTHESHSEILHTVREQAADLGIYVSVFQDLCGPKIRIGEFENGEVVLVDGAKIHLKYADGSKGTNDAIYVEAFDPVAVMKPGEKALLADGRIELVAEEVLEDSIVCSVTAGGLIRSRSGISVPDSKLDLPCLTEKDIKDLAWGCENDVDYMALSFVGSAKDILELKKHIADHGKDIPIIAKVERATSLDNINEIAETADAVMVARGDLGLELPLQRVPSAQKLIIETSNFAGTPVITATQMLQSMVNEIRPTRAEVSDVCTAVRDGTDAVMLSEETAVGKHPVQVIKVLNDILIEAEKELYYGNYQSYVKSTDREIVSDAVCYAACAASNKVGAAAVLACTNSGYTARLMSKYRPRQPLFGVTSIPKTLNRMALLWGVQPTLAAVAEGIDAEEEINHAMKAIRDQYGFKPGQRVVLTAGLSAKKSGSTNLLEIRDIPRT